MQEGTVKKIGFFGYEYSDLVWYIARMYAYTGGQVVIADMTKKNMVMASLCTWRSNEQQEVTVIKGIRVIPRESFKEENFDGIDCIIFCFSYDWSERCAEDMTDIVFVTDMKQSNAEVLSSLNISENERVRVIVRDVIYTKYSIKTLVELTGTGYDEEKVFELPYNEVDYRSRCYMCIDRNSRLEKLSSSMRDLLERMYNVYFGTTSKKVIKEIFRKA